MGKDGQSAMTRTGPLSEIALAPAVSAGAVAAVGALTLALTEPGPLSLQMAQHIAVMNVAAPLVATFLVNRSASGPRHPAAIWLAGLAQIVLLWSWHAPQIQQAAAASFPLHAVLGSLLFASAVVFWVLVVDGARRGEWRSIAALMVTGKLACLLGALMIFASRDLYLLPSLSIPFCSTGPSTLEDQQVAGLFMITACPLSYLVAGTILAAQMFARLDRAPGNAGYGDLRAS